MRHYGWFKDAHEEVKDTFEYKLEWLELNITQKILDLMEIKNITRSDLAEKLNVSKASISKLLNQGSNITVKRLLKIAEVLEYDLTVDLQERRVSTEYIVPNKYHVAISYKNTASSDDYSQESKEEECLNVA